MNEKQFVELLQKIPNENVSPNYRMAFKIYIISHGLLPSVFFESSVSHCLESKQCKKVLNIFFQKYELPLKANDMMIYNVYLMSEHTQKELMKRHGFTSVFIGKALGYPYIMKENQVAALQKKNNPFYEVEYNVRFYSKNSGLRSEWLTGWFFTNAKHSTPKGKPHFLFDLSCVLQQLQSVYDVEQHISKCPC